MYTVSHQIISINMHQGNWKCSSCGGAITELPFEPKSESGLTCRSCYMKSKDSGAAAEAQASDMPVATEAPNDMPEDAGLAGEPAPADDDGMNAVPAPTEKPKFSGEWKCAECGGAITSLPFEPRSTNNLKCIDCFKKSRG